MSELVAKMRWFPKDALIPIKSEDLDRIGRKHSVVLTLEEVTGKNSRMLPGGIQVEETHGIPVESATQCIVTVKAKDEGSFRRCVREVIDTYRGPVPIWGLYGSTPEAEVIANELLDQNDGW
ncbi:MAG: hypothetical protein Q8R28_11815 [Dehalococcoidia bacterium]|nr:hypothetical protein [Dehalococcoidia bacterium]